MNHNVIIVIALIIALSFLCAYAHSRCARPITSRSCCLRDAIIPQLMAVIALFSIY